MYFESDTKLLEIQEGEVSGLYNIYNPSLHLLSGNIGTLILRLEPIRRLHPTLYLETVDTAIFQIHTLTIGSGLHSERFNRWVFSR